MSGPLILKLPVIAKDDKRSKAISDVKIHNKKSNYSSANEPDVVAETMQMSPDIIVKRLY